MSDCIFCKIIKKEIPAEIVYEDDRLIAFLDIRPVNLGHTLLIPKEHYPYLTETPDEAIGNIFVKAKEIMRAIKETTMANFVVLSIVGTDVPHLHLHLIPRFLDDGLHSFWPTKEAKKEENKKIATKLRERMK